jgi:uncharacterized membrane protein
MSHVVRSVEIMAPVEHVYEQWARFEEYPRFVDVVDAVWRLPGGRLRCVSSVGGVRHEWLAEVVENESRRRIAWQADDAGHRAAGVLTFEPVGPARTRVTVHVEWLQDQRFTFDEGSTGHQVEQALETLKGFLEARRGGEARRVSGLLAPMN